MDLFRRPLSTTVGQSDHIFGDRPLETQQMWNPLHGIAQESIGKDDIPNGLLRMIAHEFLATLLRFAILVQMEIDRRQVS